MSVVSSYISSRAPVFSINVQASPFMDHIAAILFGLALRLVVDQVGYQDHRLTGSLVGLWEGVIIQHFIKKTPKSFDPYVSYGVRLFIDFLLTESLTRLVLTLLWTGMGVVFADIAPGVWGDTGLRRKWRHLRRDLYTLTQSVPAIPIPYFERPRTVRFSPSRAPSAIPTNTSAPPSPSIATITTQTHSQAPVPRKRPVPGAFPEYNYETETEVSVASGYSSLTGNTRNMNGRRRPTVHTESEMSYDPDEGNLSSSGSGTPTPAVSESGDLPNIEDVEDMDVEEQEVVLEDQKDETTPRAAPVRLPPTPSESGVALPPVLDLVDVDREGEGEAPPPTAVMPHIPDDEDWERISRREAEGTPPTEKTSEAQTTDAHTAEASNLPPLDPFAEGAPLTTNTNPPPPATTTTTTNEPPQGNTDTVDPPATTNTTTTTTTAANNTTNELDFISDWDHSIPLPEVEDHFNFGTTNAGNDRPPSYAQFDFGSLNPNLGAGGHGQSPVDGDGDGADIWGDRTGAGNTSGGAVTGTGTGADADLLGGLTQQDGQLQNSTLENPLKNTPEDPSKNTPEDPSKNEEQRDLNTEGAQAGPLNNTGDSDLNAGSLKTETNAEETNVGPPISAEHNNETSEQTNAGPSTSSEHNKETSDTNGATGPSEPAPTTPTPPPESANKGKAREDSAGQTSNASAPVAPVVDEDPFVKEESNSRRLDQAFALRKEIVKLSKDITKAKRKIGAAWSMAPADKEALLVEIRGQEESLEALKAKAQRWYTIVSDTGEDNPPADVDLSEAAAPKFNASSQIALILCLLKNIPKLTIQVGAIQTKAGKARKVALTTRLEKLPLKYELGQKDIIITLPTSES